MPDRCACGLPIADATFAHFMACGETEGPAEEWYAVLGERIALRLEGADPDTFPEYPTAPAVPLLLREDDGRPFVTDEYAATTRGNWYDLGDK